MRGLLCGGLMTLAPQKEQNCFHEYRVLTPLLNDKFVTDIKANLKNSLSNNVLLLKTMMFFLQVNMS